MKTLLKLLLTGSLVVATAGLIVTFAILLAISHKVGKCFDAFTHDANFQW